MTARPHGPYGEGFTRNTMVGKEGCQAGRWHRSQKSGRRTGLSLLLDSVNAESLGIVDQHATVLAIPGLVPTAHHTGGVCFTRSR